MSIYFNHKLSKEEKQYNLRELTFIVGFWMITTPLVFALVYYDNSVLLNYDTKAINILRQNLSASILVGFVIGLTTGLVELYFFKNYLQFKSFYKTLVLKLIVNMMSIIVISTLTVYTYQFFAKGMFVVSATIDTLLIYTDPAIYQFIIIGLILSLVINFILIIKSNIGHSIFIPIILGRYHQPKEEDRIFLFLDLISSTHTAEDLGHILYSQFIQDCFRDLGDLVIRYGGAVYQFVGDEAVITWKSKSKSYNHSVMLFFAFERLLASKEEYYLKKYGVTPMFKATINSGNVMVAEVGGKVKSEIAFHGDVLNTAARMMELNKKYNKKLLFPEHLVKHIDQVFCKVRIDFQGVFQFRGKDDRIKVYGADLLLSS